MTSLSHASLGRGAAAGAAYFAVMFGIGFVLGTVRVMLVAPLVGEWTATFAELPIMLAISWVISAWLIVRMRVPRALGPRLVMGVIAFSLLMAAEVLLGLGLFGRTLAEQIGEMTSGPGFAGLLGQVAFATFPLVQLRLSRS